MARPKKNIEEIEEVKEQMETTIPESPVTTALQKRRRDPNTGLLPGFDYKFDEFGRVDWESLIPSKYFYPNKDRFSPDVDISSLDVSELPPDKKILNLDGIRFLAEIRGLKKIEYTIGATYPDYSSISGTAEWEPCIDQNMQPYSNSGVGEAHAFNNVAPFKYLLSTLATNKCFSRIIRDATRVKTYACDELRGEPIEKEEPNSQPKGILPHQILENIANSSPTVKKLSKEKNKSIFETVRDVYISGAKSEEEKQKAASWTGFTNQIDGDICYQLIGRIKKKDEATPVQ